MWSSNVTGGELLLENNRGKLVLERDEQQEFISKVLAKTFNSLEEATTVTKHLQWDFNSVVFSDKL